MQDACKTRKGLKVLYNKTRVKQKFTNNGKWININRTTAAETPGRKKSFYRGQTFTLESAVKSRHQNTTTLNTTKEQPLAHINKMVTRSKTAQHNHSTRPIPNYHTSIVRPANRDWACQTERCHALSNKTSLQ